MEGNAIVFHEKKRGAERSAEILLSKVEDMLTKNEEDEAELVVSLKDDYIIRAKAASYIVEHNPDLESDIHELKKIAGFLQVDEMHLEEIPCDREGYALYQTTISDTGIGMSEEFLPHIFEEFARENNTTDNKIEGTGLGMPIVKRLVECLDGTIEVKSKKGVGTTIIITLPHRIAEKSDLVTHAGVEFDPKLFEGKRILLAEDNELNAEIAIEIL